MKDSTTKPLRSLKTYSRALCTTDFSMVLVAGRWDFLSEKSEGYSDDEIVYKYVLHFISSVFSAIVKLIAWGQQRASAKLKRSHHLSDYIFILCCHI